MDKRWQMVLDCLGAEHPPFSQGTLFNFQMRLITHNLDKTLLDRTVRVANYYRRLRCQATARGLGLHAAVRRRPGRRHVEPLGHALRKAVGLAAQAWTSAEVLVEDAGADAGGTQRSQSGTGPGLGGAQRARSHALGLVLEEVERWQRWLEQQHTLAAQTPPLQEVMGAITQLIMQDTEPSRPGGWTGRATYQAARRT